MEFWVLFTDDSESKVEDIGRAVLLYNYFDEDNGETMNGKTETDFKLLKIRDRNREVCVAALNEGLTSPKDRRYTYVPDATNGDSINSVTEPNVFNLTNYSVISEEPVDLLAGDISNNLAIYDLTSAAPATSAFYITSFILGTIQGGININASGNFCATPEGYNSTIENFNYCAINKFNFAAQANGG